jgi:hypothetical protein
MVGLHRLAEESLPIAEAPLPITLLQVSLLKGHLTHGLLDGYAQSN